MGNETQEPVAGEGLVDSSGEQAEGVIRAAGRGDAAASVASLARSHARQIPDPFGEQALLTPAMATAPESVPPEERRRLLQYLEAVVATRPSPVHVTVAFNTVYFGYDLNGDGYGRSTLRLDEFPVVAFGERMPSLPVGAMLRVATGSDPLYAELVYKEGAHPAIGALGELPAWVSGAPAGAIGPGGLGTDAVPRRRELLVLDPHAFGAGLSLSPAQMHRLRSNQRWINEDGHVLVDASHASRKATRPDDLSAYADHLLTTARAQLLSPLVPVSLASLMGSTRDDALRIGLLHLLGMVRDVLVSSELLRMWGPYAVARKDLAARWRDSGPLGGDDLRSLATALERAATPSSGRHGVSGPVTVYTAIGPRLRAFHGARDVLAGLGYASAVCHANIAIADVISGDSERGLFPNGTRVALDDSFEGGAIWRSHAPGDEEASVDPLSPAGRGWARTMPDRSEEDLEPVDSPATEDSETRLHEVVLSEGGETVWRTSLRLAHLIDRCLPLPPRVAQGLGRALGARCRVRLEFDHPGVTHGEGEVVQNTLAEFDDHAGRLIEVTWPQSFFPGLLLNLRWSHGSQTVRAATTPLGEAVCVDGRFIGHAYDPRVLTREDAPGCDRNADTAMGLEPRQLVLRTVRRCGLLTVDGHALLDRQGLPVAVYGQWPPRRQVAALETAVVQLLVEHRLETDIGSRDGAGRPYFPARQGEQTIPLVAYRPATIRVRQPWGVAQAGEPLRHVQFVPGHLRRLLPGRSASATQRAAFREHCRSLGKADGWELPEGYTFVTQHTRGH
ncbi:hypothetical protein [Streptomyces sp. NPDC050560]|uniref:hypothetical protein n=1 Tax=Streptomyces sp. NPDC050560 TaxID=3365630 RepID=UPI0037A7464B